MKKLSILLILITLLCCANDKLDDRDQLFLDFAWQEDYYQSGYQHRQFKLFDIESSYGEMLDEKLDADKYLAEIKKGKLQGDGYSMSFKANDGKEVSFPHTYTINQLNDSIYDVKIDLFIPDTIETFVFSKDDIGKEKILGLSKVKLLYMEDDCSIFVVEDLERKCNYEYTNGMPTDDIGDIDDDDNSDDETKTENSHKYWEYFGPIHIYDKNAYNSQMLFNVIGNKDTYLKSEFTEADFRHYLWYRSDVPYPEMLQEYQRIQVNYKELEDNDSKEFHPIYTLFIRSYGEAKEVEVKWRSSTGKNIETNLGEHKLVSQYSNEYDEEDWAEIIPEEDIRKNINVRINNSFVYRKNMEVIKLYASLPLSKDFLRNSFRHNFRIYFEDIILYNAKGDSTIVDMERLGGKSEAGIPSAYDEYNNLTTAVFPKTDFSKIKGNIVAAYVFSADSVYSVSELPEDIIYNPDTIEVGVWSDAQSIYGYDKDDKLVEQRIVGFNTHIFPKEIQKVKVVFYPKTRFLTVPFEIKAEK